MHQEPAQSCVQSAKLATSNIVKFMQSSIAVAIPSSKSQNPKSYDLLEPYPSPTFFYNIHTNQTVLAQKWSGNVRFFFYGRKYNRKLIGTPFYIFYGIRSRIVTIDDFNNRFKIIEQPDNTDSTITMLSTRKSCPTCEKSKFLIEFSHSTKLNNSRSERCIDCINIEKSIHAHKRNKMDSLDRSIKKNFIMYMQLRPAYFKSAYELEATDQNILAAYDRLMGQEELCVNYII